MLEEKVLKKLLDVLGYLELDHLLQDSKSSKVQMRLLPNPTTSLSTSLSHLSGLKRGLAKGCIMWKLVVSFVVCGENEAISPCVGFKTILSDTLMCHIQNCEVFPCYAMLTQWSWVLLVAWLLCNSVARLPPVSLPSQYI